MTHLQKLIILITLDIKTSKFHGILLSQETTQISVQIDPLNMYHLCGWVLGSKIIKANLLDTILLRHL